MDMLSRSRIFALLLAALAGLGPLASGWAAEPTPPPAAPPAPGAPGPTAAAPGSPADVSDDLAEITPARVSYINGDVSFWRPGAEAWAPARVNTPLAPGDRLYTGPNGNVEIQVGPRAFLRAAESTQIGVDAQEPSFLQVRVTGGHAALDLRELASGQTVELDTPHGAFTIERAGYYRTDVTAESTSFATRRGGRASLTPAGGAAMAIDANQHVVLGGAAGAAVSPVSAEMNQWDRWNYARTDEILRPPATTHVATSVYGAGELERHGTWRHEEAYGPVWVPAAVPAGWAPYSVGRWIWDPRFGWTWLDDAPWGWAPYHYGRWVHVRGYWGWAPGPVVVRPVYAPALVVFLGGPVVVGRPVFWAPLGWGEPVIPWWGRPGFRTHAWWGGWGGPRVVNNVVVQRNTVVNVNQVNVYRNVTVANAVVGVPADRFGRTNVREARLSRVEVDRLAPVRGAPDVRPVAASLSPASGPAVRPPEQVERRNVVTVRPPREGAAAATAVTPPGGAAVRERDPRDREDGRREEGRRDRDRDDVRREQQRRPADDERRGLEGRRDDPRGGRVVAPATPAAPAPGSAPATAPVPQAPAPQVTAPAPPQAPARQVAPPTPSATPAPAPPAPAAPSATPAPVPSAPSATPSTPAPQAPAARQVEPPAPVPAPPAAPVPPTRQPVPPPQPRREAPPRVERPAPEVERGGREERGKRQMPAERQIAPPQQSPPPPQPQQTERAPARQLRYEPPAPAPRPQSSVEPPARPVPAGPATATPAAPPAPRAAAPAIAPAPAPAAPRAPAPVVAPVPAREARPHPPQLRHPEVAPRPQAIERPARPARRDEPQAAGGGDHPRGRN